MTSLLVRRATPPDAAGIAAVHLASWRAAYRDDAPPGWLDAQTIEDRTASWWDRLLSPGRSFTHVVLCGGADESGDADEVGEAGGADESGDAGESGESGGADADSAVIGFCGISIPSRDGDADEDTAELGTFYVDPDRWRAGAGRALMAAALAELTRAGFETVTLWVLEGNVRARAFYVEAGFAPDGARQISGPGWPYEIRMRRALT